MGGLQRPDQKWGKGCHRTLPDQQKRRSGETRWLAIETHTDVPDGPSVSGECGHPPPRTTLGNSFKHPILKMSKLKYKETKQLSSTHRLYEHWLSRNSSDFRSWASKTMEHFDSFHASPGDPCWFVPIQSPLSNYPVKEAEGETWNSQAPFLLADL